MFDIPLYPGYKLTEDFQIIGKSGSFLSLCETREGYKYCNVYVKKPLLLYLHRAIALVHVDGYFDGAWVDHIDDDHTNNHPSNLQWVIPKENCWNVKLSTPKAKKKRIASLSNKIDLYKIYIDKMEAEIERLR